MKHRNLSGITAMGVDELTHSLGHKYMALIEQIDVECRRLLVVIRNWNTASLPGIFEEFGKERCAQIKVVCSDEWKPHLKIIAEMLLAAFNILNRPRAYWVPPVASARFSMRFPTFWRS